MLSKTVESGGRDWDERLLFILFAYRDSPQQSTGESPFSCYNGKDPQLPRDAALVSLPFQPAMHIDDYKTMMVQHTSDAWRLSRDNISKAQKKQKAQHDRHAIPAEFDVGDCVFVLIPAARSGPAYKLVWPFHGPFRVIATDTNVVEVRPKAAILRVSKCRVRQCPPLSGQEKPHLCYQEQLR